VGTRNENNRGLDVTARLFPYYGLLRYVIADLTDIDFGPFTDIGSRPRAELSHARTLSYLLSGAGLHVVDLWVIGITECRRSVAKLPFFRYKILQSYFHPSMSLDEKSDLNELVLSLSRSYLTEIYVECPCRNCHWERVR
jgi:hypothetical protein